MAQSDLGGIFKRIRPKFRLLKFSLLKTNQLTYDLGDLEFLLILLR